MMLWLTGASRAVSACPLPPAAPLNEPPAPAALLAGDAGLASAAGALAPKAELREGKLEDEPAELDAPAHPVRSRSPAPASSAAHDVTVREPTACASAARRTLIFMLLGRARSRAGSLRRR